MKFLNLYKLIFLSLLLLLSSNQVLAEDQLSQLLNNLQTSRSNFTQTVMNSGRANSPATEWQDGHTTPWSIPLGSYAT